MKGSRFLAVCAACVASAGITNPALAGDPLAVCVGREGSLRLGEMNEPCRPGEQKTLFTEWEPEAEDPPEGEDPTEIATNKKIEALSQRIAAIESRKATPDKTEAVNVESLMKRVAALESRKKVTAPFEVVGRSGSVILRVAETVTTASGQGAHVTIGAGAAGNYAVRIHKGGGPLVAGIGQSLTGAGIALVTDTSGEVSAIMDGQDKKVSVFNGGHAAASITADGKGGTVAVYDGSQAVAYLTRSSHGGGGNLTLSTSGGFGVFSAGAASDGGGEACLNRVTGSGKQRNVCLGVELPSMGLGK
jgi:hypothetical protein